MAEPESATRPRRSTAAMLNKNFGRILVFVYGVLALSATGRAVVQLATKFHHAPVAYVLSGFSALVYIAATFALGTNHRRTAIGVMLVELVGVLVIGSTNPSSVAPDKQTVWTDYGSGYGFVPLALPFVVIGWLLYTGRSKVTRDTL